MIKGERIIMGIDPGTNYLGYGLLRVVDNKPEVILSGALNLSKMSDSYLKLRTIFKRTLQVIDKYHPDELAIESQFFGKNVQSMLKLGRAQGVAIAAALQRDIPISEYAPKKIKIAVTGNGEASKEQVALMLQKQLKIEKMPSSLDETDALAIALCHFYQSKLQIKGGGAKSWKEFAEKNPARVKK
ncbi:Holliday junction endonuclease RuvC [Balneicella halophila]|uniref:Crossover junction endodeoxyribonuclease RuvC n=2 Tax=Balneicella halophila TaxID=1537566 RepID=A0A7L4URY7_BALHA|nr:crossover junction endodeoxyribonuclease RuvC [Balneicella halophila]PVX52523.1 Holliday junction endonuclease RuvC [Balneicella halophila]